jgi:hypothetical protein
MPDSPPKIVYYPAPPKVYSKEDMRGIFSAFHPNDPIIAAITQIFQVRFANAALDAAQTKLSEREAGHAGGRIQEITDFRDEILSFMRTREVDGVPTNAPNRKRPPRVG